MSRTADQWVRWYYVARDSHGPAGMDIIEQSGYYWAETCYECGSRRDKAMRIDDGNYCGKCGKAVPWAYELAYTLRGQIQRTPDRHIGEKRLTNQVTVGYAIEGLLRDNKFHWKVKAYICKVMSGLPNRDLGIEMVTQFPEYPLGPSKEVTRCAVNQGRAMLSSRLQKLGLTIR